jgi:hypothetical protein
MPGPGRIPAADHNDSDGPEGSAGKALNLMVQALELLDREGGAHVAGAHLDLAIHRLREWIGKEGD